MVCSTGGDFTAFIKTSTTFANAKFDYWQAQEYGSSDFLFLYPCIVGQGLYQMQMKNMGFLTAALAYF